MADTIREQIITAYMTRLASWTTTNGFHYSCGATAQRAVQHVEYDDLPACVLWSQMETAEQDAFGQTDREMELKLEALAAVGDTNPSVVQERLLGDGIKIMTDPAVIVTALIEDIVYVEGGPAGIGKSEEKVTAIAAKFKVKYATLIGDPYSQ